MNCQFNFDSSFEPTPDQNVWKTSLLRCKGSVGGKKILLKGTESVGEQPELFSRREKNDFMRRGCEKVIWAFCRMCCELMCVLILFLRDFYTHSVQKILSWALVLDLESLASIWISSEDILTRHLSVNWGNSSLDTSDASTFCDESSFCVIGGNSSLDTSSLFELAYPTVARGATRR